MTVATKSIGYNPKKFPHNIFFHRLELELNLKIKSSLLFGICCTKCSTPIAATNTGGEIICGACLKQKNTELSKIYCASKYEKEIRQLVLDFKVLHRVYLAKTMADLMLLHLSLKQINFYQELQNYKFDFLLPIPQHYSKILNRGFNPAFEISRHLQNNFGIPVENQALVKFRDTLPQTALKYKQRIDNVKNCFAVKDMALIKQSKRIVLIDDVYTTGSTIKEVAKVIKKCNPELEIYAWIFAKSLI